jgi:hypothetical protein
VIELSRPVPAVSRAQGRLSARSLAPKEHGAYGQLGLPLVAALGMGRPGASAFALAAAAALAFVAHEPLLILAGQRGARARRDDGARALRRLAVVGAALVTFGGLGLALAPRAARAAALVPLALAAMLAPFIVKNREKTALGELLAAAALSSAALPVAIAAGASTFTARSAWAAWLVAFAASTLAVRAVVAHAKAPMVLPHRVRGPLTLAIAAIVLERVGFLTPLGAAGAAPMLALALALAAAPPRPTALRRVGWALVAASIVLCAAITVGAHI